MVTRFWRGGRSQNNRIRLWVAKLVANTLGCADQSVPARSERASRVLDMDTKVRQLQKHKISVILVEDDRDLAHELGFSLQHAGYEVRLAETAKDLDALLERAHGAIVVLSLGLAEEDGLSISRRLATQDNLRLVALTERDSDAVRLQAMQAGFDAVVAKPVNLDELEAVLLRLASRLPRASIPLRLDQRRQTLVSEFASPIKLTTLECWFLVCLAQAPGLAANRRHLEERLWSGNFAFSDKRLDMLVHRLRAKLTARSPDLADLIGTQWGHGYCLLESVIAG